MARKCFYSFHYIPDNWRAGQVRNIGVIEGNSPVSDNSWEAIKRGGDPAIRRWIDSEMQGRTCVIVLIGSNTANRKWINHEIAQGWNRGMGVVGIYIHGLKNRLGYVSLMGQNPFDFVTYGNARSRLSSIVKCYNPPGSDSSQRYAWIAQYIVAAVEEAIRIRSQY